MLNIAQTATAKIRQLVAPREPKLTPSDVQTARQYIKNYWPKLTRHFPKDDDSLIGLPNPYLVPAHEGGHDYDFDELYYWDSYFMVQGMLDQDHKDLVVGILENLLDLQKRFKIIPNASRTYLTGRSQPPLLTSFIFDVYEAFNTPDLRKTSSPPDRINSPANGFSSLDVSTDTSSSDKTVFARINSPQGRGISRKSSVDKKWLKNAIEIAQQEYETVWMGTAKPNWRNVYKGLSRYFDVNILNDLAETESGWDMTPRFEHKALNFLPVDLNALLFKYETDFARAERIFGDDIKAKQWENVARRRKKTMNELMWSNVHDFYFDYNYVKEKRGSVKSLAGYYPMWAGMVDDRQAWQMVKNLRHYDQPGGLSTTDQQLSELMPGQIPTQWAYPNGWAPLHFMVVKALQRYGYTHDAQRIALKWLKTNLDWFNKNGLFLEKYNVVQPDRPPVKGVYPSPIGFGWTNAVFERFCQEFIDDNK